jgi:hypothetical protein
MTVRMEVNRVAICVDICIYLEHQVKPRNARLPRPVHQVINPVFRSRYMGVKCDADSERCSAGDPSAASLARLPGVRCEAGINAAGLVDNN